MGVPSIKFTEEGRVRLLYALAILNWICMFFDLALLGFGAYIKLAVQRYYSLVTSYDGDTLPYMLVGLGLAAAVLNGIAGAILFLQVGLEKRKTLSIVTLVLIFCNLLVIVALLAAGMMCFTHIKHLSASFKGGLMEAMKKYKDDQQIKEEFDLLQLTFACCGNEKYTDWFHIPWIHTDYLNIRSKEIKRWVYFMKLKNK